MKKLKFEWYVLNEDFNKGVIEPFNIFQNLYVLKRTNELCVEYKRKKMTFADFTESLRRVIMSEEWARCEYEIVVSPLIQKHGDNKEWKIDCYEQALPNMKLIAKYVLEEYYPRLKINLDTEEYTND